MFFHSSTYQRPHEKLKNKSKGRGLFVSNGLWEEMVACLADIVIMNHNCLNFLLMKVVTSVSILISFQRKVKYTGWLMASIFIAVFGNSFLYGYSIGDVNNPAGVSQ